MTTPTRLEEPKALITGGTQGLGLDIAKHLIKDGCKHIIVSSRDEQTGASAVAELKELGADAKFIRCDLGQLDDVFSLLEQTGTHFGAYDMLTNSAASCARGSILEMTPEGYQSILDVNTRAPFFLMQGFAKQAIAANISGSILNISSLQYHCGLPFLAGYTASKAALTGLTKNVANTLKSHRIRANAIALGWMDTPGEDATQRKYHGAGDDWLEKAEAGQPFGQLIKTHEVAELAAYLLSHRSGVMTGSIIDYDQTVPGATPEGVGDGA